MAPPPPGAPLLDALRAALGPAAVVTDPGVLAPHEVDWTGAYRGRALVLVRPRDTASVAVVVRACRDAGAPVVVQGGNTGLVGGSVPDGSGTAVVVSTAHLDGLGEVDRVAGQATFGAGVALARAAAWAGAAGFEVPVDLSARGTATIGGMVATNAGGVRVLRHGTMRRNVVGVEAVLGDGSVISHLGGLDKDNTGYDLAGLLCGSEGTLGVVTHVRLRLVAAPVIRVTALLAVADLDAAVALVGVLRGALDGLEAAEYFVAAGLALVVSQFGVASPFAARHPAYVLVEVAGGHDPAPSLSALVGRSSFVLDAAVATSEGQRAALWRLRDLHTEALAAIGPPRKYDVSVPLAAVPAFVAAATALAGGRGLVTHHWGHLGDGNVHVNLVGAGDLGAGALADLDGAVLGLVAGRGGSISAEHGIGRLKRPWLHLARSPSEVAAFRAVKAALDPAGIMNPGVLLPDP